MRRALGSNQRQALSCSCPPSKETKDEQESRDTVLSSPSPTTHSSARLAGLHRDTRHFHRPDAQLRCQPGHSWTASSSAPTAMLTIETKTPQIHLPTGPWGGEERGQLPLTPSPDTKMLHFRSCQLASSSDPIPISPTQYTHRRSGLFKKQPTRQKKHRRWCPTKWKGHRTFRRLSDLFEFTHLFTGNYSNSPCRVVIENINSMSKVLLFSSPLPTTRSTNHRTMPFDIRDWAFSDFSMGEGWRGSPWDQSPMDTEDNCIHVLDMLKLLIYSAYGVCMPVLEGVLKSNDLT